MTKDGPNLVSLGNIATRYYYIKVGHLPGNVNIATPAAYGVPKAEPSPAAANAQRVGCLKISRQTKIIKQEEN